MRPVRLDLEGFASFRDATTVDFSDADYFAFVGPTGSGKSTVVDAMTFALYGSAPRWGSISSIQYALAPTANRCTVRLIFDVAGQRYVVAREVRRTGAQISQRNCSLERYADPAATGDPAADEPTEILAENPRTARDQVVELLGLDFEDFCTCVVLPQGDFATFLKASAGERQNILLKLLGAKHYDAIGKIAGRRSAEAGTRIEVLAGQQGELADATEEAESTARSRETELAALEPIVATVVDSISAVSAELVLARQSRTRAADESRLLSSVTLPAGVGGLQQAVTDAQQAYRSASEQERLAADAARAAQTAVETGPQRGPLELALGWRKEKATGRARLGDVSERARTTADQRAAAEQAARAAETVLDECRRRSTVASAAMASADEVLASLQRRIHGLADVRIPDGVDDLATAATAARTAQKSTSAAVALAESDLSAARDVIAALPERSALDETARTIDTYETAAQNVTALTGEQETATATLSEVGDRLAGAAESRDQARERWERLRVEAVAADLRPELRVGHACPVCDQTVATLPTPLHAPLLDAARDGLAAAERKLTVASADQQTLTTRLATLEAQAATAIERCSQLDRSLAARLPDRLSGASRDPAGDRLALGVIVEQLGAATERQATALRQFAAARTAADSAEDELLRIDNASAQARAELHATLGRLTAEQPPQVDAIDLATAWGQLTGWVRGRGDELTRTDLPDARRTAEKAQAAHALAIEDLAAAVRADRQAGETHTAVALVAQRAADARDQLLDRLGELDRLLVDQPESAELTDLLAECDRLAESARQARMLADAAALTRQTAERDRDARLAGRERGWTTFHAERERLVPLGVPTLDADDLALAWEGLLAWTTTEIERRATLVAAVSTDIDGLDDRLRGHEAELATALTAHGLEAATAPAQVVPMIMVARERARADTATVVRRRRQAERLRAEIAKLTETQQVARELQQLMSARKFPQWLADAALDTLVADASASLLRLSNNQFDLTHDKGEFFVIDHADADSRRSVRTLSGGETFQASLALALALSEQLSTLAAGGRTTLDSIFLDEGFGTLDPDALEIVAGTLENLAQEDRMVGVITHVSALAERVPVRFEISRSTRTSLIVRVGP